jgi:hypothetical protein
MGTVAIGSLAAPAEYIRFYFALSSKKIRFYFACPLGQGPSWKSAAGLFCVPADAPIY